MVYTSPFALFSTEYGYSFYQLSGRNNPLDGAIMQFYLMQAGVAEPMEVETNFYDIFSGALTNVPFEEINFSAVMEQISFESEAMAEIPEEIISAKAYFAIPANKNHCSKCRFRAICQ